MSSKAVFSLADLQSGSKQLNSIPQAKASKAAAADEEPDIAAVAALEEMYNKYDGDLDLMYACITIERFTDSTCFSGTCSANSFSYLIPNN